MLSLVGPDNRLQARLQRILFIAGSEERAEDHNRGAA